MLRLGGYLTKWILFAVGGLIPLYIWFSPGSPGGIHGGGRREGKLVSGRLTGTGWLCIAPGQIERMNLSGTMYGGYLSTADSLVEFRRHSRFISLREGRKATGVRRQG